VLGRATSSLAPGALLLAAVLGCWQAFVDADHLTSYVLPAPSAIFAELGRQPRLYLANAWGTIEVAFLGFVLAFAASLAMAVVMVHSRFLDRSLSPIITLLQAIPVVVLAAPLVIWLGLGTAPQVIEAALITFVPLARNAVAGLGSVDAGALELMRSVDATRRQVLLHLRIPHSLPYLVAAAKVSAGLALIGATVVEYIGPSTTGLGVIIAQSTKNLQAAQVWAAVFVLTFLGILAVGVVTVIGDRLLARRR
jgi:NitT/TauT family transport system permease protein